MNRTFKKEDRINILIIDENVAPLTLVVVRCLGLFPQYRLHVLSLGKKKLPQFRFSRYISSCVCWIFNDEEHAYTLIKKRAEETKAFMVIPVNEKTVKIITSHIDDCRNHFNLPPMPELSTLNLVRHKWSLYKWLNESGYPGHRPFLVSEILADPERSQSLIFPLLVKPNWGSGGNGIVWVSDRAEFDKVIGNIKEPAEYVIQPVIPGNDIDISILADRGKIIAYTIQKSIETKSKLIYSKSIEFIKDEALLQYTQRIIGELGYSGIAHLDFRYDATDKDYKLIDFNARYWSSLLGSLNAGINFPLLAVNQDEAIKDHPYRCSKYYIDNNPVSIITKHISFRNTELWYNLFDPLPFFADIIYKIVYHLKKLRFPHRP